MSTTAEEQTKFEPRRFPGDVEDFDVEDHMIVATDAAIEAVAKYWQAMAARPSLLDFEVMVAGHYSAVKLDQAGYESPF